MNDDLNKLEKEKEVHQRTASDWEQKCEELKRQNVELVKFSLGASLVALADTKAEAEKIVLKISDFPVWGEETIQMLIAILAKLGKFPGDLALSERTIGGLLGALTGPLPKEK